MTASVTCHAGLRLVLIRKIRPGMSVIAAASNALAQAVAVDHDVEAEAVVAVMMSKTGLDVSLPRTERLLISRNNSS